MKYIIEKNTVDYSISEQEHIIYQENDEKLVVVNCVAACIWRNLKNGKNIDEIVRVIGEEFKENDEAKIKTDVLRLIDQLSETGLIRKEIE